MKKRKNIIKVAIDSPAASGAGTQAKLISDHYKLLNLDTGKIYRFIGNLKIKNKNRLSYSLLKKKIKNLKMKNLKNKNLLKDKIAQEASIISKDKKIRKLKRSEILFINFKYNVLIIRQKNTRDLVWTGEI